MKKTGRKVLFALGIILIIIQFIPINAIETSSWQIENDFIEITQPNDEIKAMLISSCYDCHSETSQPTWYSDLAPVSWWINGHINEAKEHLSFSQWGTYDQEKRDHKLEECMEEIKESEMPLPSYVFMHGDADLSEGQKDLLVSFFQDQR